MLTIVCALSQLPEIRCSIIPEGDPCILGCKRSTAFFVGQLQRPLTPPPQTPPGDQKNSRNLSPNRYTVLLYGLFSWLHHPQHVVVLWFLILAANDVLIGGRIDLHCLLE